MRSGSITVEWDADGHLNIRSTLSMNDSASRKECIEKLLDAARAINNQGTPTGLHEVSSTRLFTGKG